MPRDPPLAWGSSKRLATHEWQMGTLDVEIWACPRRTDMQLRLLNNKPTTNYSHSHSHSYSYSYSYSYCYCCGRTSCTLYGAVSIQCCHGWRQ